MNPQPGNNREKYIDLPNTMSIKYLHKLEKVGIIEPLEFNEHMDYMKPFKIRLSYFHPKRHIPAINWTHDMNLYPVECYTFSHCQSMQNIQMITNIGGCSKYTIKYIGKIDAQNYVFVYIDSHNNGTLVTKGNFYTIKNSPFQNKMKNKFLKIKTC